MMFVLKKLAGSLLMPFPVALLLWFFPAQWDPKLGIHVT